MGLLNGFLASKVEKSNFYKDLEGMLEWDDCVINITNGKKLLKVNLKQRIKYYFNKSISAWGSTNKKSTS